MTDNDDRQVGVIVQVLIQPRPDGVPWVGLQFSTALDVYVVAFPPDQAITMADNLPEGLRNAAQECQRQATGLILPHNHEGIITHE